MSPAPDDSLVTGRPRRSFETVASGALLPVLGTGFLLTLAGTLALLILQGVAWPAPGSDPDAWRRRWTLLQVCAAGAGLGMLLILSCGALALILYGRAALGALRTLRDSNATVQQQVSVLAERTVTQAQARSAAPAPAVSPLEVRALLLDIRETLLLPEAERSRRFQRLVEREIERGLSIAERYVGSRDFHRAREELAALAERFGQEDRLRVANERLERAAESARASDLSQATRRVDDLMSVARWDEAERGAREVLDKYPVSQEANTLLIRVQRERKVYEQRHRQRLFEEIQQSVTQRRWREAAASARQFLENFPAGADSDAIRAQRELLEANADIQARQSLEQELKELVRQHQYWDALALARRIIAEHPLSPQANALRNQVARLEELARQSNAPAT